MMMTMLPRKVMVAAITSAIYPLILFLGISALQGRWIADWYDIASGIPVIMLYSAPAIFLYGIPASMISDKISDFITRLFHAERAKQITATTLSVLLHMLFGLILSWYSIVAAILFYVTDVGTSRFMHRTSKLISWKRAERSLVIPIAVWVLFWGIVWIRDSLS